MLLNLLNADEISASIQEAFEGAFSTFSVSTNAKNDQCSITIESGVKNFDKSSDHFVVIVGRKYDDKGELCYLFYEVGTNHENKGTSDDNKFYIKNNQYLAGVSLWLRYKDNKQNKHYFVTQIRKNLSYK